MGKINIFYIVVILMAGVVIFLANNFTKETDAIIAQVEPQRIAISYQKPVRIKILHIVPGQDVNKGDLLLEVERPDLMYEIEKLEGDISRAILEKSDLVRKHISELNILDTEKRQSLEKADLDIAELRTSIENTQKVLISLQSFSPEEKSSFIKRDSSLNLEIEQALSYRDLQVRYFSLRRNEAIQSFQSDTSNMNFRINRLDNELTLLNNEAVQLKKYAPCNGTIGNVYWQTGELIQPYETIISVYESNPTLIKAYMNIENRYDLNLGDKVKVLAVDRKYDVEGNIIDIGSRIVGYPSRLLPRPDIELWGQEIFIRIPDGNEFLSGEKVIVRL
ncbi:biotin/lipoyl-binding protein [Bacteroidota bacterium]